MRGKVYICDDCKVKGEFSSYKKARAGGWAVAKDYTKCYCPKCAPDHRHGGASNKNTVVTLPPAGEQLSIDNL